MDDFALARVIHILGVILLIGGVAMVTTVIIPAVREMKSKQEIYETFQTIEGRFAFQAKIWTLLTGLSGFYMIYEMNAWDRYFHLTYWWIYAMTLVWILFTLVLFLFEPLFLHKLYEKYAKTDSDKTFRIIQ